MRDRFGHIWNSIIGFMYSGYLWAISIAIIAMLLSLLLISTLSKQKADKKSEYYWGAKRKRKNYIKKDYQDYFAFMLLYSLFFALYQTMYLVHSRNWLIPVHI